MKKFLTTTVALVLSAALLTGCTGTNRPKPTPTPTGEPVPTEPTSVSYTHLRAHETPEHLVCRLPLENKKLSTSCPADSYKHLLYH